MKNKLDYLINHRAPILYYDDPIYWHRCQDFDSDLQSGYSATSTSADYFSDCPYSPRGLIRSLGLNVFSFQQHQSLVQILEILGLSLHGYDLATIVRITQCNEPDQMTHDQQQQCQKWIRKEGDKVRESHALKKEKLVPLLQQLRLYQTLFPHGDTEGDKFPTHTLLLGGSIQQMQMRFLTMVAYFDNYGAPGERPLGDQTTLTCNRVVNSGIDDGGEIEIDFYRDTVWFASEGDHTATTGENKTTPLEELTEDTAYHAIHYGVRKMCEDKDYFKKQRYSVTGFHTHDHYPASGAINYLYKKRKYYYELTDEFLDAACRFIKQYPLQTFSSPEIFYGTRSVNRPTTKETVKNWLGGFDPCSDVNTCNILTVSNQPNARYQQVAVLQGMEDKASQMQATRFQVMLTAMGSSTNIPTDEVLDNLTRVLYLILKRPPR